MTNVPVAFETPSPSARRQADDWHTLDPDSALERLVTSSQSGLSDAEAARRLSRHGANQLEGSPPPTFLHLLVRQFHDFIVIMLIVAALISAALGEWIDAAAILAIVMLNAVLGIVQEKRAEAALAALKKLAAPDAQVLRGGARQVVPAHTLVPGDIVFLETGNFVPADMRLIEAVNLRVEEAALTGESVPVQKAVHIRLEGEIPLGDRKNSVFMGTVINFGRGCGVVTGTGMHTQIGLIARMLQSVEEEETPLQKRLAQLGETLGWAALAVCTLVFAVGWLRGQPPLEMFMLAVGLAIAAVPEGLPAVVTISLALGMREMIRHHALIRRLSSVETLGSTTVICSDKTGTLTQNEMRVTRLWSDWSFFEIIDQGRSLSGEFRQGGRSVNFMAEPAVLQALWLGALNNDAGIEFTNGKEGGGIYRLIGDPTESALLVAAAVAGMRLESRQTTYPRVAEIPFDSDRKRMITIHRIRNVSARPLFPFDAPAQGEGYLVAVKGAPDLVLGLCSRLQKRDGSTLPIEESAARGIREANDLMTRDALRVLGVAYKIVTTLPDSSDPTAIEQELVFAGLLGMMDPARPEVPPALRRAAAAGIRTVMITGDYPNTALAIAEQIGLLQAGHQMLSGAELDRLSDPELMEQVQRTDVFARVSPEHKLRIVRALRASGEVVAMTGDGVNDAPSIKAADIGVAMGIAGTDVAKEAADMVLTDDNYASIVAAVEQGRIIYDNIRQFVFFLLSSNVAEIMIIFLATLAGLPPPLTVIQLLWLNLLTDGAPALALALEKGDPGIMRRPPRSPDEPIIGKAMRRGIVIQTFAQTGAVLGAFAVGLIWHLRGGDFIPEGMNSLLFILQYNWSGVDVQSAETMSFATLSLCELMRAYTVRSERESLFVIGVGSNPYMQAAVGLSLALLLLVMAVPVLQPIFNTHFLSAAEWAVVLGLALIPALAEELTKSAMRRCDRRKALRA